MRIDRCKLNELDSVELRRRLRIFIETLDFHFIISSYGHSTILTLDEDPSDCVYIDGGGGVGADWGP